MFFILIILSMEREIAECVCQADVFRLHPPLLSLFHVKVFASKRFGTSGSIVQLHRPYWWKETTSWREIQVMTMEKSGDGFHMLA